MSTRYVIQEDGVAHILLEDSSGALIKDSVAQSSDDVLIRLGPGVDSATGSGLLAPTFTASGGGATAVYGGMYYQMMQNWFNAA